MSFNSEFLKGVIGDGTAENPGDPEAKVLFLNFLLNDPMARESVADMVIYHITNNQGVQQAIADAVMAVAGLVGNGARS